MEPKKDSIFKKVSMIRNKLLEHDSKGVLTYMAMNSYEEKVRQN